MIRARYILIPLMLVATAALHAGDQPDPAAMYKEQIASLRREVADVTLELRAAQRQLKAIGDFLAERDLAATFERWEEARAELAEERRRIQRERVRLEAARDALDRTTRRIAEDRAAAEDRAERRAREAARPDWSAQYQMGVIYRNGKEVFVDTEDGSVFIDNEDVDRRNIVVRGTFLNKSAVPWRYTFEARAAGGKRLGGGRRIVGSWRYQTPLLAPGKLHKFELTMPVEDISRVRVIQIGNVVADRPAREQPADEARPVERASPRHGASVDAPNAY